MQRIVIIGTTGSGKTTLGRQLAERLGHTLADLDSIYWLNDWQQRTDEEAKEILLRFVRTNQAWILSGNYSRSREIGWSQADTLLWLDYPFWILFARLLRRSIQRIVSRQALWGTNNRETWGRLLSRESILLWLVKSYWRRKKEIPEQLAAYPGLQVIRLQSPRQTKQFLDAIQL